MKQTRFEESLLFATFMAFGYITGYTIGKYFATGLMHYFISTFLFLVYFTLAFYFIPALGIKKEEGGKEK
ncbi:hypothetical protein LCGC14_3002130 [marine sediment metagenome]|uniref:Uncharacterized protein n=1 Tax=marine sediment metagenome TaxID=412755 RepID=A0A0F8Z8A1_9ZZZZ